MAQVESDLESDGQTPSLTRRTFLQATLAGSTTALLTNCSMPNTPTPIVKQPTTLHWLCEGGYKGDITSIQLLTQMYNALNNDQVTITVDSGTTYDVLQQMFTNSDPAKRAQYDILSIDVVWITDVASNGWVIPLDRYWRDYKKNNRYLPIPLQAASYHDQLYGAPLHTDVGILYYRTDFADIIKPENIKSWDDLASMAQEAQQQYHVPLGFAWQALPFEPAGNVFEGLICNFVEILFGYGGKIFDNPHSPSQVLVNSQEARNALKNMLTWAKTISPGVINDNADNSTYKWTNGTAAFMRNWPAAVVDSIDHSASSIADKFAITTLPSGGCLGGWQLAINSNSSQVKQDHAWNFIWWMLQHDAQHYLAIKENYPVTLTEIYHDEQVTNRNMYYSRIKDYINNAQFRPAIPNYQAVTKFIATMIKNVLTGKATPEDALPILEAQLQKLIATK